MEQDAVFTLSSHTGSTLIHTQRESHKSRRLKQKDPDFSVSLFLAKHILKFKTKMVSASAVIEHPSTPPSLEKGGSSIFINDAYHGF